MVDTAVQIQKGDGEAAIYPHALRGIAGKVYVVSSGCQFVEVSDPIVEN